MDFLVINSNKLKIMMSKEDMMLYGINGDAADYDNPDVRRAFWRVLDAARESCGFDVTGEKILIQFYPSGGGCEIFVTKLGKIATGAERLISKSQNVTMLSSRSSIYKFPDLQSLITAIRHIREEARSRRARLYLSEDGGYYLIIEERSGRSPLSEFSVLGEYATSVPITLEPYIVEHSSYINTDLPLSTLAFL